MAVDDIIITELDGQFTYCRRDNTGAGSFDDNDTEALSRVGTQQPHIADSSDFMYWGHSAAFRSIGFVAHTAGDYATPTWEYWNGSWTSFTPSYDGTADFSTDGYIHFPTLSGWTTNSVDSQSAYWVRVSYATVNTTAQFYSFLRNITLERPVRMSWGDNGNMYFRDDQGNIQKKDIDNTDPLTLTVDAAMKSLASTQLPGMHLLRHWHKLRSNLYIADQATTSPLSPTTDSFITNCQGYLLSFSKNFSAAAGKMDGNEYMMEFIVDNIATIFD